ncbi:MAG: sulfotransferase [Deltaproteobacteria bacterium]|nr:sulfotransferase [Deltaproteobacteria bacterium]
MGPQIVFEEQALLAAARRKSGLSNFGDPGFREPLRRLLHSLEHEAQLSESGRTSQYERVIGNLVTRLSAEEFITRHPEILQEEITAPAVIVGPTRSGTTRLQRLLCEDPRHFAVLWWENRCPVPLPGSNWRTADPRIPLAQDEVRRILEAVPELASIHPWDPLGPDEDALLCEHAFLSHVPESSLHVPSYRDWLQDQDQTPAYEFLARMLRILQWQKKQRGERGERWILKTPQHLGFLEDFSRIFPDARIIQTHRDPCVTLPSAASMFSALWKVSSDEVDRHAVGRQVRNRLALDLSRSFKFRERHPSHRICDVRFEDMQCDPVAELERVYAWLGTSFPAETRRAVDAWLVKNAREKRPPHRYGLQEFGLEDADLKRVFATYRERFILTQAD